MRDLHGNHSPRGEEISEQPVFQHVFSSWTGTRLTAGENEANAYGEAPRELGLRAAPSSADCGVPEYPSVRKLREFLLHFSENENILKNGIIFELVIL